jgi:glycosyltransferase involved in cell wall biosynthesis
VTKARILMVGPGADVTGGITTLVQALVPVLEQQVDLLYLSSVRDRPLSESGKISIRNLILVFCQYVRFMFALVRFRPNIIHVHTSYGIAWLKDTFFVLIGKACGCQIVLHMHGGNFFEIHNRCNYFLQLYTSKILGLSDKIITLSAEQSKCLVQIVPSDRVDIFKNCLGLDAWPLHSVNPDKAFPKALFLGRVGPSKGVFDLLDAMASLKSKGCALQLFIAGDEERKGNLEEAQSRLSELHLEDVCHLIGLVIGEKKQHTLSEADMFVLPSYYEGLPMSILEALATGLPVISTPVGGIPEVVRDGYNGFIIPPGNVEALAEKMSILTEDPCLRETMGRRSREIAEQELDVKSYVGRLIALYESVVGCF